MTSRASGTGIVGVVLVLAAALMLLARLPGAYRGLDHTAKAAAGRNELGGALATADSIGLNDDFVRSAFSFIPENGRFAVLLPKDETTVEKADGVSPITFNGVPAFFANYLLPRRQIATTPTPGDYVVCFYCDAAAWKGRIRWVSPEDGGGRIGLVRS
jgi:hypothetical protein